MHVRLDGVERIVRIASELLDVNMDPVTNPLNAIVMPDGLDLSVKDVSLNKDSFINSTPKLGLAKKDLWGLGVIMYCSPFPKHSMANLKKVTISQLLLPQHQSTHPRGPESASIEIPPFRPKFT